MYMLSILFSNREAQTNLFYDTEEACKDNYRLLKIAQHDKKIIELTDNYGHLVSINGADVCSNMIINTEKEDDAKVALSELSQKLQSRLAALNPPPSNAGLSNPQFLGMLKDDIKQ